MIKWVDCLEGEILYEFFLPEHEAERCEWLVRVSARGHILDERRGRLTWRPKFGPDCGDVAVVEAATDEMARAAVATPLPDSPGTYVPQEVSLPPTNPMTHAVLYALVEEYSEAERALGLTPEQTANYLQLPVIASAAGLHPFAVTPQRDNRMRRAIALMHILKNHPETAPKRGALLDAVLAEDITTLKNILADLGLPPAASESEPDAQSRAGDHE
jgi:hypothetical protein